MKKKEKKEKKSFIKKLNEKLFHPRKILLITNRGSDNCGDQVLEQSDIALVRTVMKNLHISRFGYTIISRDAGLVPKRYVKTHESADLKDARRTISSCDVVLFGGAPMFNHLYQIFYERTALTVELAQEYGKPVIFSAIGIEAYDAASPKCRRISEAVNLPCVKRITTRDDYEALEKMRMRDDLPIGKVPDPAVFSSRAFRKFNQKKKDHSSDGGGGKHSAKKRIGVFVLRERGFEDNRMPMPHEKVVDFYSDLHNELVRRGYDYRFLTSGHFADEAALEKLISERGVPKSKSVLCMLSPEQLFSEISGCDGVISCRLHPSIISYSCGIPSVGLEWNMKVSGFYDSIGYSERVVKAENMTAQHVMDVMEKAMAEGVSWDETYMHGLYTNLFEGLKEALDVDKAYRPYSMEELLKRIPAFRGTDKASMKGKLDRKFRRIYDKYNSLRE